MKFSQSKISLWRRCHYAYAMRYIEGLRPKKKARPLEFGTLVHRMLQAEAEGDDPFSIEELWQETNLFEEEKKVYLDAILVMRSYFEFWKDSPIRYIRINGKSAEHEFEIEVEPDIVLTGRIDAFGRFPFYADKSPEPWLIEHKTFDRRPSEDHRWRNLQVAFYLRIVEMLGWLKPQGILWNYIHSKPHKVTRSDDFERVKTVVPKKVVDTLYDDAILTAHEIQDLGEVSRTRTIGLHCQWCEYEPICRAALQGLDADFIIAKDFEKGIN